MNEETIQEVETEVTDDQQLPEEPYSEGIPIPNKFHPPSANRTRLLWIDKLPAPKLREGRKPDKDISKLDIATLNKKYVLSSGFEQAVITSISRALKLAEKRNNATYVARTVTEEHGGVMVTGTRVWRIS